MKKASSDSSLDTLYPVPSMFFKVTIGTKGEIPFQTVTGLKTKYQVVEYRSGNSKEFENIKMPLSKSSSDVVLRKGMFKGNTTLFDWFMEVKLNKIKRESVTIELLNEESKSIFKWILKEAFPKEVSFGELDSMNASFAVEELIIAHEGLTLEKP